MEDNQEKKDKEIKNQNEKKLKTISTNIIYSNLSTTEEIKISFDQSKPQENKYLSPNIFRCHLCKELMTTKLNNINENINIEYICPNNHFGSLDISLFLSKIPYFSFINAKCAKCGLKQEKSKEIFFFCKDCEEIYCQIDIKECILEEERVVSLDNLDYLCITHKKDYILYCINCNKNLCEICIDSVIHKEHEKIYFKDKLIGKEENDNIDEYIKKGKENKNKFENELEMNINDFNIEKFNDIFLFLKNKISEKIKIYDNLISYAFYIKKSYDFCVNYNRFNYQIIKNLYELVKNQLYYIDNKNEELNRLIIHLKKKNFKFPIKNDNSQIFEMENKNNIKYKDQKTKNNIEINPKSNNNSGKKETKKIVIKKYIFEEGEYLGDILNGLPHGHGVFNYKNGDKYIGDFKNGLFDGNGELTTIKGEQYQGEFKNGKKEGNGAYKNKNGEIYSGHWKENKKDGQGKYTFSNGDFYKGEFKEDMFNGRGNLFYSNGNKTIGIWKNNKRNGIELLFNNKGEIYYHYYENNTLIQERKMDVNNLQKDFRDFNDEKIMEHMNNFYQKHLNNK